MKEVGTSYAPSFPLLQLHYLLQCKKYPEGGEECLIHNASASSCFVYFFPVCGKSRIILFLVTCPVFVLPSSVAVFSVHTTSPAVRFW